jgi:large subunit ribosomal protein L9
MMLAKQLLTLPQRRAAPILSLHYLPTIGFTRSFRKILLLNDVENLGFKGEWVFVKPGYAFNRLVPEGKALFATDPAVEDFVTDQTALKRKQEQRVLEVFLSKLRDIRIIFDREVSDINKNVAKTPVNADEVLESLNKRYNLGIKK